MIKVKIWVIGADYQHPLVINFNACLVAKYDKTEVWSCIFDRYIIDFYLMSKFETSLSGQSAIILIANEIIPKLLYQSRQYFPNIPRLVYHLDDDPKNVLKRLLYSLGLRTL